MAPAALDLEAVVAAVRPLEAGGEGVTPKALAEHLGVAEKQVGAAVAALVEGGKLVWRSRRPKRVG